MSLEKITLYKEMLLIEPASKIFFPLAKLLCSTSAEDEAIAVLESGITLNPEYFEARLLLIELLYTKELHVKKEEHIEKIISLFSSYNTFLTVWNEKIASMNTDMSIALSLLSSSLNNEDISLNTVLQSGFQALKGMKVPIKPEQYKELRSTNKEQEFYSTEDDEYPHTEICEPVVVHTRSMADLLIEQGALEEALLIYKELHDKETNTLQKDELTKIISSLEEEILMSINISHSNEMSSITEIPPMAVDTKHKIITTLAALVERLDARADAISPK